MKTIKVLEVAPLPKKRFAGGPTAIVRQMMKWSRSFAKSGLEFSYFNSVLIDRNNSSQGKLSLVNICNALACARALLRRQRAEPFDVIHLHSSMGLALLKDLLIAEYVAWRTRCPMVFHVHFAGIDDILPRPRVFRWLTLQLMRYGHSYFILLSERDRQDLIRLSIKASRLSFIPNFHFKEKVAPIAKNASTRLNLLYLGSLDERKGFIDLIQALNKCGADRVFLRVGGRFLSATLESQVRAYIEENELKNKVEFLGYLEGEKKDQVFADSDVLVLPTYGEGMPVVILEALSWGLPALTTPVGAISEVLSDGLDSILFDPGDVHFLADAIAKLEADRKLVVRLSQRALTKADSYTPSMFRQRLSSLFREIYKNVLLKNL